MLRRGTSLSDPPQLVMLRRVTSVCLMPLVCCGVLCLCFWLVFILYVLYCSNVAIWEEVILNVKYMHEQFPALCYHGRDKGSSFADASFTIDDTRMKRSDYNLSQGPYSGPGSYANRPDLAMCSASDPSDSQCQMQCQWEISVYPCLDKDVDVETFQHCKSDYTDDVWEVRPVQKTWVGEFDWRCWGNGVREEGYSSACSATSWDCDGTPCDAEGWIVRRIADDGGANRSLGPLYVRLRTPRWDVEELSQEAILLSNKCQTVFIFSKEIQLN